jgi:hypothetical protein
MPDIFDSVLNNNFGNSEDLRSLNSAIDQFNVQNMSPSDIYNMAGQIPRTLGGIPGVSAVPGLSNIPIPGLSSVDKLLGPLSSMRFGTSGSWESVHYADDLNFHQPKFKFLFKVGFYGFAGQDYYYYVHRCDKPKVRFNHQDVNYYNFRTRVLTSVTFEPLTITFLDEIGNSVHDFFVNYLSQRSGTGSGNYGIDQGFGEATSSRPYSNAYTEKGGQRIIVEQVFANGTTSNRYVFINPRIEQFDFDELSMEDSTTGSTALLTFSYDAIECLTVYGSTIHSWGNLDLLRGGAGSIVNGGDTFGANSSLDPQYSVDGGGVQGHPNRINQMNQTYQNLQQGMGMMNSIPSALQGTQPYYRQYGSGIDMIGQGIQDTLRSITSGANMNFAGGANMYSYPMYIQQPIPYMPISPNDYNLNTYTKKPGVK